MPQTFDVMSVDEARALTDRIKRNLDADYELVIEAYQRRADVALGYPSFDVYIIREFKECRIRLPREKRAAVVKSLRENGLSIRAIAAVTGIDKNTVMTDLGEASEIQTPEKICGLDGKQHPSTKPRTRRKITLVDRVNKNLADMQQAGLNLEKLMAHQEFDKHRDELDFHCRTNIEWAQDMFDRLLRQILDHDDVLEVKEAS
jgi:hypothetical protein